MRYETPPSAAFNPSRASSAGVKPIITSAARPPWPSTSALVASVVDMETSFTELANTAAVAPARSPRWVRAVLLAAAALLPIALVGSAIGEREGSGAAGAAVAAVWYAAICLTAIGAYATAWRAPGSGHRIGAGAAQHPAGQRARELAAP